MRPRADGGLCGEALAASAAPPGNDIATTRSAHAHQEPMGSPAFPIIRLKRSFHGLPVRAGKRTLYRAPGILSSICPFNSLVVFTDPETSPGSSRTGQIAHRCTCWKLLAQGCELLCQLQK